MQTYEILVQNRSVVANSSDTTLVRTSVGVDKVHVMFDNDEWMGFPITVTFANGDVRVSQSLAVTPLDSEEWVLEGECVIPWEVIRDVGSVRVTFQGTDSQGNHVITAYGEPLSVEECGDSEMGEVPDDAPTVDQWNQAYADAMAAVSQVNSKIAEVNEALLAISSQGGVSPEDVAPLAGEVAFLVSLAELAFDMTLDEEGAVVSAVLNAGSLPVATDSQLGAVMVDGETITADADGMISVAIASGDGVSY